MADTKIRHTEDVVCACQHATSNAGLFTKPERTVAYGDTNT